MTPRYPAEAYIGVEYEGKFRLCTITQFVINPASSVVELRHTLESQLDNIRSDRQSVKFSRRPGSVQQNRPAPKTASSNSSAPATSSSKSDLDAMDLELMLGILPKKAPQFAASNGSATADEPQDHHVVTVSSVSVLLTDAGVAGLEGLGSGIVRLVSGIDFFTDKV